MALTLTCSLVIDNAMPILQFAKAIKDDKQICRPSLDVHRARIGPTALRTS